MNFPLFVAFRYLFSAKRNSAINIVSMICSGGVCVGTMALVCILSVYNGFQGLISDMFSVLDQDVKITMKQQKSFDADSFPFDRVFSLPCVEAHSCVFEENALVRYNERQTMVLLKGVDDGYVKMLDGDTLIQEGSFVLSRADNDYLVIGVALAGRIGFNLFDPKPVQVFSPIHDAKVNLSNPQAAFNESYNLVAGIYTSEQEETDSRVIFVPIRFSRRMFGYDSNRCTSVELKLKGDADVTNSVALIRDILGDDFSVDDRVAQHSDFHKMLKVEKWITFLILVFILLIAVVNVVGSLSMLIIEKKTDISTMYAIGASNAMVRQVFLLEGWLVSVVGAVFGVILGLLLCFVQMQFGLIKLAQGGGLVVDAYPVAVHFSDVLAVFATVVFLGFIVAWLPTRYIKSDFSSAK